ncbi:hypothetical protein N4G62_01985 [Sphingomonas sanguinis]|uniref:Uncharacterized protein n=1 Tax=Sphingomonas sanguinis TaxID=33051 RepID=A0ABU5LM60_9SPHN|nr:hypothetical protein [Sphingomonas sanguinis]
MLVDIGRLTNLIFFGIYDEIRHQGQRQDNSQTQGKFSYHCKVIKKAHELPPDNKCKMQLQAFCNTPIIRNDTFLSFHRHDFIAKKVTVMPDDRPLHIPRFVKEKYI